MKLSQLVSIWKFVSLKKKLYILHRNLKMEIKTGQIPHCGPVPSKAKQDSKCIKGGRYTLLFCKIRPVDLWEKCIFSWGAPPGCGSIRALMWWLGSAHNFGCKIELPHLKGSRIKIQILWEGHKIWKKSPVFKKNYVVFNMSDFFSTFCCVLRISEL